MRRTPGRVWKTFSGTIERSWLQSKLDKAIQASKRGMAFIHIFSPCPTGWRFSPSQLIEVARKGVETNMVPLWEYESELGRINITHVVDDPLPVTAYLKGIGKYRHLSDEQMAYIQRKTDERMELLKKFTKESKLEGLPDAA